MAVDTPATIAIIGAGPIGLEAALYGRFLGYDVLLFDRGCVAAEVQRWGHAPLNSPFGDCTSKLGLAALHAQHPTWKPPSPDAQLTGHAWRTVYLLPLAHSDLLVDGLHEYSEVISVERARANEQSPDEAGDEDQSEFRLRVRGIHPHGSTTNQEFLAQVVIDASGSGPPAGLSGVDAPAAKITGLPATARPLAMISKHATEQERMLSGLATLGVLTSEPDYYLLGSKTSVSASELFAVSAGLDQIRALYTIIGDRPTLDLYATMTKLLP